MSMFQTLTCRIDFDEPSMGAFRVARYPEGSMLPSRTARHGKGLVLVTLSVLVFLGSGFTTAQDKAAEEPNREADRRAIAKLTRDMIQAVEKRDAAAITAHWMEAGEFIHNDGTPIRGRADIQKGYAAFFKTLKGKPKLEVQMDAVRFLSADMAVSEATLRLKSADGETVASGRQDSVLVRDGSRWKVAMVREWDRDTGLDVKLQELEWL